jgi:REP element-mobilizing transposase RayT
MSRALRIERPGGRYHVTARENERNPIFRDDSDRFHFQSPVGAAVAAGDHAESQVQLVNRSG